VRRTDDGVMPIAISVSSTIGKKWADEFSRYTRMRIQPRMRLSIKLLRLDSSGRYSEKQRSTQTPCRRRRSSHPELASSQFSQPAVMGRCLRRRQTPTP